MTNLFSWELILFLFFFFIYMFLVFWQKRKWSELDKLNKDQEVKFVTYVNGMYFFWVYTFSVLSLSLSLSLGSNHKELFFLYDFFSCFKLTHLSCILCNENLKNMLTQVGSYIYACKDQCL